MKLFIITWLFSLFSLFTCAQSSSVSGRVLFSPGVPIAQATVAIRGTAGSTLTEANGHFTMPCPDTPFVLVISHIGYITRNVPARAGTIGDIILQEATAGLDEVIVQAYGTTTRRYTTGNIGKMGAADIERQPVTNPLAALQGRVPGVVITQSSGVPGSEFKIEIRGRSSLDQSFSRNDPLYVIDNVPFEPGNTNSNQLSSAASVPGNISRGGLSPLNSINPADIESIEILKDADATAIYGSRGANGVVLITTKKGKSGKSRLTLNLSSGFSRISSLADMMNTQQYVQMRREGLRNDNITPTASNAGDILIWDTTRYTDYKKLLLSRAAFTSSAQATISGGNAGTQFSLSGSYNRQTNVFSSDLSDQVRSARFTINHTTPDKKLSLIFSGIYSSDKNNLITADLTQYLYLPPNLKLYDSSGKLNWSENGLDFYAYNLVNPLSVLKRSYSSLNENLSGNLNIHYQLLPGLVLRTSLGYNVFSTNERSALPRASIAPTTPTLASAQFAGSNSRSYIIEPQAEYKRNLAGGQLTVLAGATWQDRSSNSYQMSGTNYTNDLLLGSIAAAGLVTATNQQQQYRYSALFGRVNYALQNTYILNLTGRRDASSRFGRDKQIANFGAAGAAWIFTAYPFIRQHLPFLSFGKIRASYGITGNDQIGNYRYLDLWSTTTSTYQGLQGLYPSSLYNPDYSWEKNKKAEIAIETGFLKDRLLLSAAYYRNRCDNLIANYKLPSQTGYDLVGRNLPAVVENTGLELLLSGTPIKQKAWQWTASLNMTLPKNRLLSFPGLASSSYASTYVEGKSLTQIIAYDYLGVDPQTGVYSFRDRDGNGTISNNDKMLFGNLDVPLYGGLQNTVGYKGLQLSVFFEFRKQTGRSYLSQLSSYVPGYVGFNQPVIVLDRWQQKGDQAPIQRYTGNLFSTAGLASLSQVGQSSGIYKDASYIRCKNVALSFTLPAGWMKKMRIESSQVFFHAQNLFVITGYKGSDPETQNFFVLPPLRTFVGGLQINL